MWLKCSSGALVNITTSSMYTNAIWFFTSVIIGSMARWNVSGACLSPNRIHMNPYKSKWDGNAVLSSSNTSISTPLANTRFWLLTWRKRYNLQRSRCTRLYVVRVSSLSGFLGLVFYSRCRSIRDFSLSARARLVKPTQWWLVQWFLLRASY